MSTGIEGEGEGEPVALIARITCPECGHRPEEYQQLPAPGEAITYECDACGASGEITASWERPWWAPLVGYADLIQTVALLIGTYLLVLGLVASGWPLSACLAIVLLWVLAYYGAVQLLVPAPLRP